MWISELGIHYKLGLDGLNLFLVLLTGILWFACTLWAPFTAPDRPPMRSCSSAAGYSRKQ